MRKKISLEAIVAGVILLAASALLATFYVSTKRKDELEQKLFQWGYQQGGSIDCSELGIRIILDKSSWSKAREASNLVDAFNEEKEAYDNDLIINHAPQEGVLGYNSVNTRGFPFVGTTTAILVLIRAGLNEKDYLFTKGHENGHVLSRLGRRNLLYDKFRDPQEVMRIVYVEEAFADLAGFVALRRAGVDISQQPTKLSEKERKRDSVRDVVLKWYKQN